MSLASLLLKGNNEKVDNELDSLFLSQPAQPPLQPTTTQIVPKTTTARKEGPPEDTLKRKRTDPSTKKLSPSSAKRQKPDASKPPKSPKNSVKAPAKTISKSRKKEKRPFVNEADGDTDSDDDEENDPALENRYLRRTSALKKVPAPQSDSPSEEDPNTNSDVSSDDDDDEEKDDSASEGGDYDINAPPPKHETQTRTRKKKTKKAKYIPPGESAAQRDARTVFIGNVSIDIVKSRPAQKQLKRYILQLVPQAKIESIRFRSIAFSAPTNSLKEEKKPDVSTKEKRQMERAETWRKAEGETKKGAEGKRKRDGNPSENDQQQKSAQPTLTPAQRKRVAFYKQEFHNEMNSANAYVVFAHTHTSEDAGNDSSILHPAEAARLLVEKGNGDVFMSRTLRMDRVGQWRAGLPDNERNHINLETLVDPHCTLFVGNLDFAAKEEDLRIFFDTLVSKERNEPENKSIGQDSDEGSAPEKKSWVKNVRVIRDKETQLGKGFAYVRFIDRECIDEVLALEPGSVKFAKRKLRIQKCKGLPGATPKSTPTAKPYKDKSSQAKIKTKTTSTRIKSLKPQHSPVVVPKGDPNLGAKLASLSKEERKVAKAADSARLERRLAKKQAKSLQVKGNTGAEKLENKQRHRQRRGPTAGKKAQSGSKKTRLRSEKSLSKRNMKK